ncbi:hypothetical protein FOL47_007947 [Perkinsus chesapeaki]|uniref:DNA polymerase delta subunit 3 n=1 Tax=Perkinsus chesapeaki TaxID=330153 RepID=A0A7J6MUP6_PERCH|nr:hypothetical protein FOL47_007947 [Perkinsus chesapeaki]
MYSGYSYTGTRVLETNYYSKAFEVFNFSQQATVDRDGDVWIVDKKLHAVLRVPKSSRYLDWPLYYELVAGRWGRAGYRDGSNGVALFNAPLSLAVWEKIDETGVSRGKFLLIADTGNHCVRRVSITDRRTVTLAGKSGHSGGRDGDGLMALLDTPTSIGVEGTTGKVMVLDARDRLRLITVRETANDLSTTVTTIVKGACRSMVQHFILSSIVVREVWCHTQWLASSVPQERVEIWQYPYVCVGHIATCGPRNHPAISDRSSAWLESLDNFTKSQNQTSVDPDLQTGTFVGYSVQVGDVTSELPGMSLLTARKCLFAYAQRHPRDVEVDFCILGVVEGGQSDMVIVPGNEELEKVSTKFDKVLARYVYRLRATGSGVKCSPHAMAPTVLHAVTSDRCRNIITDVKSIAPKAHEMPLSATQIEITKAQEKANPLAAMFAKAAQKKAAAKKKEDDKTEVKAEADKKAKSPVKEEGVNKTKTKTPVKSKSSKAGSAKAKMKPVKKVGTPPKGSQESSPASVDDDSDDDDEDIMVMPKKGRRAGTAVKRQREETTTEKAEKAPTEAQSDLFKDEDTTQQEAMKPGDENSSVGHNAVESNEVKRRKKTTETKFSLGDGGYMEVEDVVGFKEDSQPAKKAAPPPPAAAGKSKPKPVSTTRNNTKRGDHTHQTKLTSFFTKKS